MRSSNVCCNLWEVLYGSAASWFRLSKPRLASSRSAEVESNDAEARRPDFGRGMISGVEIRTLFVALDWYNRSLPELKGITEEKGEYGRASSTVGGLDRGRRAPLTA